MKILAIDTATERCSVALMLDDRIIERSQDTQRTHAELVLPMVAAVLQEGAVKLAALDALAYGRGPGAFTGVRIAVGVIQGLGFGSRLPTVGVSDLAAVAQQAARPDQEILVCMDARMGEVYWARFAAAPEGVRPLTDERVDKPERVHAGRATIFAGTGFKAYPQLAGPETPTALDLLPRAREIAILAAPALRGGAGVPADRAAPVYLRDQVATVKRSS